MDFQRGEPQAVERVRGYVHRILAYRRLQLPREEIPDLEQQIMTELWRAATRPSFDPTAGFWGFVETVTARRCVDVWRRARPSVVLPDGLQDDRQGPLEGLLTGERARLAEQALTRLGEPCRRLIELHALRRLSYREIAPILGKSEGALRVQLHRCIEKARRIAARLERPPAAARLACEEES